MHQDVDWMDDPWARDAVITETRDEEKGDGVAGQ